MAARRTARIAVCAGVENTVSSVGEEVGEGVGGVEVGRALMPDIAGYRILIFVGHQCPTYGLLGFTQIAMNFKHIPVDILREDITQAVCQRAFLGEDPLPHDEKAFKEQIKRARSHLPTVKKSDEPIFDEEAMPS